MLFIVILFFSRIAALEECSAPGRGQDGGVVAQSAGQVAYGGEGCLDGAEGLAERVFFKKKVCRRLTFGLYPLL